MRHLLKWLKPVLISLVILLSFVSFLSSPMGEAAPAEKVLVAFYNSLSLFLMAGQDIGFPQTVGSPYNLILWICYFLAPLLTVSYVYEFIQIRLLERIPRRLKDHTVICGVGRSGRVIYELLRETLPAKHKIVLIDQNVQHAYARDYQQHRATWWLKEDFTKQPALLRARVQKAQRIFLTTDMDIDNLNALMEIVALRAARPEKCRGKRLKSEILLSQDESADKLYCHLSNPHLLENLQATLFHEAKYARVQVLNGFSSAAALLYRDYVLRHISEKPAANGFIFIFLGYGIFGRMLYQHLQADPNRGPNDEIIIATLLKKSGYDIDLSQYAWEAQQQKRCTVHPPLLSDIHDPALWKELDDHISRSNKPALVFLCRDNDIANLELAVSIKRTGPATLKKAVFFCRMFMETTQELQEMLENRLTLGQAKDVILFPMQRELKAAFRKELFNAPLSSIERS